MKRFAILIFLFALPAHATTYYICAATGSPCNASDSNAGTSKTATWLHAPGMAGCTATCASTTPSPGDSFIFRGGDTWHNAASGLSPSGLTWNWTWTGSSGNTFYIGGGDQSWSSGTCSNTGLVDTNGTTVLLPAYGESTAGTSTTPFVTASVWSGAGGAASEWVGGTITINGVNYTISSVQSPYQLTLTTSAGVQNDVSYSANTLWCRPILNGDLQIPASGFSYLNGTSTYYLTFDMWEIKGFYLNSANANGSPVHAAINWEATTTVTPYTLSNIYLHGWGHDPFSSTMPNTESWYLLWLNSQAADGQGQEVAFLDIDGSDSMDTQFYNGTTGLVQNCNTGNAPNGSPVTTYWPEGYCVNASGVGFEAYDFHDSRIRYVQNGLVTNNTHLFYNNSFDRIYNVFDQTGVPQHDNASEFNGEWTGNTLIYNNAYRNNTTAVTQWINPNATDYIFNEVSANNLAETVAQDSGGTMAYYWNDTFVASDCIPGATNAAKATFENTLWINSSGTVGACSGAAHSSDTSLTNTAATADGYVAGNNFAPTSAGNPTVGAGTNLTSSCSTVSTALCSDTSAADARAPVARPSTGAWDTSAFQFSGTSTVANPSCTPGSGAYTSPQTITCTDSTSGATICYRTDGTAPSASTPGTCDAGSTTYSSAFSLTIVGTTYVKALGTLSGDTNSSVVTNTYTLLSPASVAPATTMFARKQ